MISRPPSRISITATCPWIISLPSSTPWPSTTTSTALSTLSPPLYAVLPSARNSTTLSTLYLLPSFILSSEKSSTKKWIAFRLPLLIFLLEMILVSRMESMCKGVVEQSFPLFLSCRPKKEQFNQKINHLPASLTHLILGYKFNQKIDHLPTSLRHLTCKGKFNQKIDHLPRTLTHLTLGKHFYKDLNSLPDGLLFLEVGHKFAVQVSPSMNFILLFIYFYRHINCLSQNGPLNLLYLLLWIGIDHTQTPYPFLKFHPMSKRNCGPE